MRAKFMLAENEIIDARSKSNTNENQVAKLKRELQYQNDQNAAMLKELQEVTKQKDKLENNFGRLDQIERDFERSVRRVEELEELIKAKNEQLDELKKQQKTDKKIAENEGKKLKSALEILIKSEQKLGQLVAGSCTKVKNEIMGKFDKITIQREFDIVASTVKQLQEQVAPGKIDPKGASEESFQRQLQEVQSRNQKLEMDLQEVRHDFKEYKIENQNYKSQFQRLDAEVNNLKKENMRLTMLNQKQFSDTMEARKALSNAQMETHDLVKKIQSDYEVISIEYQKAHNSEEILLKQARENKQVLKALKNKIIELEGIQRDFQLFQKQFTIENHKNIAMIKEKEKEIKDLHKKLMTLEESSGDIEKKYNQLNPMKMKQKEPEPTTKEEKIKAKRDAEAVAHLTPQERNVQTVGLGGVCEIQRQVLKMEVFKSEKPKKKKKKKEKKPPQAPNPDGSIPEAEEEESYYEYYEEEVEEEEGGVSSPSAQNQGMVLSTGGVPIYVNNAKKGV
ncbi:hypothetical protein FGO68_gene7451 [Halteria grandinella]|uniref:Uncharacterized protein n=1 Tax=Halteria grandinella TaxID=5974 RepID=A0A8J8NZ69_HALGN|nr:hypothetical protein FGO68_gene7451 [Halteria grandinella]